MKIRKSIYALIIVVCSVIPSRAISTNQTEQSDFLLGSVEALANEEGENESNGLSVSYSITEKNRLFFLESKMRNIRFSPVFPDVFIGIPRDLYIIENNLLILDEYEGKQLTLVDLQAPSNVKRIGSKGQGPNEFLRISNLSYNPVTEVVHVFDEYARRQSSYSVNNRRIFFNDANLRGKTLLANTVYNVIPLGNSFVANGNFNGKQFALLNEKSEIVEEFGVFPGNKDAINSGFAFYLLNQNRLIVNPQETHFAAAGFMNDQLVFYKKEGNSVTKLKEYFNYDTEATPTVRNQGNGNLYSFSENDNTMRAYVDVYATEKHLYALYLGLSNADLERGGNQPCYILRFDWNGKFMGGYKSDFLLMAFAVDEANKKIYAVTRPSGDSESMLVESSF